MAQCFLLKRDMLVWVDETGSDSRDNARGYMVMHYVVSHPQRTGLYTEDVEQMLWLRWQAVALELTTDSVNGERFFDFVRGSLIPNMMPFDGINPRSVVIMDNCSVHHVSEVKQLLEEAGTLVLFLPPYSHDKDPLEEAFSYVKYYLKRHDELLQSVRDPTDVIKDAFASITPNQCKGWISHSGYPD